MAARKPIIGPDCGEIVAVPKGRGAHTRLEVGRIWDSVKSVKNKISLQSVK